MTQQNVEALVTKLLEEIGEDPNREGLIDTPKRFAKAYIKVLEGYKRSLKDEITVFENTENYDDIIYSGKITFFSTCEHHLLPFFGTAHIAYVPGKKIIGLSKMARAVDIFSRRLQDQERITMQVINSLDELLSPAGVAVFLDAQHFCNMARGVQQFNSNMKTMAFRGVFKENEELRNRFMELTK